MSSYRDQALALIQHFEGFRPKAYRDAAGVPTIGFGHTRTISAEDVEDGREIDEVGARRLLLSDLEIAGDAVRHNVTATLNPWEFWALVSFVFNLGESALRRSTLLRQLNAGHSALAADEFRKWNKARVDGKLKRLEGLVRRRRAEELLFRRQDWRLYMDRKA